MTYANARLAIFEHLKAHDWQVWDRLKVPRVMSPDGRINLWFRSQSVHGTFNSDTNAGNARSLFEDIRAVSPESFRAQVWRDLDSFRAQRGY